jgi:glutathione synthase/RimK-type ligase-like ATP-grasp enzyme
VAKPSWGGGMIGVQKIDRHEQLTQFAGCSDYVFQEFLDGPEKRLWFLGDEVVAARIIHNRPKPWQKKTNSRMEEFTENLEHKFPIEIAAAKKIWQEAGLEVGCVDFIGDKINELNGCGTLFTQYDGMRKIIDVREKLNDYMISQARQSTAR